MNIINGDILDVKEGIIVQQVNCKGVMGAGLAKQIRNKYPNVYKTYINNLKSLRLKNIHPLGNVDFTKVGDRLAVCNFYAQYSYGRHSIHTDYEEFEKCLIKLKDKIGIKNINVYFPYGIGCGLAGGDWNIVLSLIEKYFPESIIVKYA